MQDIILLKYLLSLVTVVPQDQEESVLQRPRLQQSRQHCSEILEIKDKLSIDNAKIRKKAREKRKI